MKYPTDLSKLEYSNHDCSIDHDNLGQSRQRVDGPCNSHGVVDYKLILVHDGFTPPEFVHALWYGSCVRLFFVWSAFVNYFTFHGTTVGRVSTAFVLVRLNFLR